MGKNSIKALLVCLSTSMAVSAATPTTKMGADFVGAEVHPAIVTVNLRTFDAPQSWKPGDPVKEIPFRFDRPKDWVRPSAANRGFGFDPLAQKQVDSISTFGPAVFDTPIVNVDGLGFSGVNPSDTNGDVGINYYVQSINNSSSSGIIILNKADGTIASQFILDDIANGSGTGCGGGRGDPVIIFDQLGDNGPGEPKGRWVLTEFTSTAFCVYISKTHDPLGTTASTWYIYEFTSATGGLPDYPKFGTWHDAYYIGANESNRQYALDRVNMLNGATARGYQVVTTVGLPGFGFQHMMPADADGELAPPAGSPGIFMRHRDSEYHGDAGGDDVLEMWEYSVDFDTPANTSMTGPINIVVSEFDTNLGGTAFGDLSVPQPGGATNLFPLKQPLMWRVQHRTIDDKQLLVGNMVTDVDGNDYHGVRWWQLERPAATTTGGWSLKDEGTYTLNDGVHRWMASTAMDGDGNIAIGYNTSGVDDGSGNALSTFAGMRYAGRLKDDPAGTMTRGENSIIEGSASNSSERYGDYTSLSVDPVDECTFWYTAQYNPTSNWNTRVASFKFEQCGCLLSLDIVNATGASANVDNNIQVSWNDSNTVEIIEYKVYRSTVSGSNYVLIGTVNDSSIGVGGSGTYTYDDATVSDGTTYYYVIKASDGGSCTTTESNEVSATATGLCTLAPAFNGANLASNNATASCGLEVSWLAASSQCPNGLGDVRYSVFRSTSSSFIPSVANRIADGLNALTFVDESDSLVSDTDYFYIVQSEDLENNLNDGNQNRVTAFPTGAIMPAVFDENLDSYADIAAAVSTGGWSHYADAGNDDWRIESGDDNTTGTTNAFVSTDVNVVTDKSIVTRSFSPTASTVLTFSHKFAFESTWDGGILEITTDDGNSWINLGPLMTTGNYNGTLNSSPNPIGGQSAWTGTVGSYTLVTVPLGVYDSQLAQVRWRSGSDASVGGGDWKVDDIVITDSGAFGVCTAAGVIFKDGFE
jgi:hypothetical protein